MTRELKERVDSREARREPPYRSTMETTPEQQKTLGEKLGGIQNYNPVVHAGDGAQGQAVLRPANHVDLERRVQGHRLLRAIRCRYGGRGALAYDAWLRPPDVR